MESLIFGRIRNAPLIQDLGNGLLTFTLEVQAENLPYNNSRFWINDQVSLMIWVFHIPIRCKGADV